MNFNTKQVLLIHKYMVFYEKCYFPHLKSKRNKGCMNYCSHFFALHFWMYYNKAKRHKIKLKI